MSQPNTAEQIKIGNNKNDKKPIGLRMSGNKKQSLEDKAKELGFKNLTQLVRKYIQLAETIEKHMDSDSQLTVYNPANSNRVEIEIPYHIIMENED